ncbi:hypothetical protein D3P09_02655 [Paenibacillus pinisoli]|uniref:SAF domain-containing protein n=1 Tax=Paenibacillus pinisoli TaxID=1276110 RepID=A0A3A6PMH5_9BACL|nr:SAF domain-containing protein [Paenibacillus pinisoli]RJX40936.1 hypothetical protein D3P09_02655 [Paenibacillus pinisoli]
MGKKLNRILLYGVVMLLALVSLFMLDTRWSTVIDTQEVLKASRQIKPHEKIGEADIVIDRIKRDQVIPGALGVERRHELIGKEALQLIETGDQFTLNRVDKESLLKSPDMRIVEIPEKWIVSVPGSLRRLDNITVYAVPIESSKQTHIDQGEFGVPVVPKLSEKVLEGIVVAYYKDTGSNEVQSVSEQQNPNIRDYANVRGSRLELQLNDQQLSKLTSYVDKGYQFIIGYGGEEVTLK